MTKQHDELLSALMDGELGDFEVRRLLRDLDADSSARWSRQHLARRAMRDESLAFSQLDVSAAVSAAVAAQPTTRTTAGGTGVGKWLQPLTGIGVAAAVAAVVVMAGGLLPTAENNAPALASRGVGPVAPVTVQAAPATGSVNANASAGSVAVLPAAASEDARARFERYRLRHAQRTVDNSGHAVLSYARAVYTVND